MFRKMSLSAKLILAFVVVALICAVVGTVGIVRIKQIAAADKKLYEMVTDPLEAIAQVSTHFQRMRVNILELVTAKTDAERKDQRGRIADRRKAIDSHLAEFEKTIVTAEGREQHRGLKEALSGYYASMEKAMALNDAGKDAEALKVVQTECEKLRNEAQKGIENLFTSKVEIGKKTADSNTALANSATIFTIVLVLVGAAAALALGIFLSASISKALNIAVASLSEGAEQVTSASGQLSASSQALAEGSSEQAASLEETASAMEEMSAMTKRNTESAGQAKTLSDRSGISVDKANASMNQLVGQMAEISSMGEEIGKIIKTIDEIAFQTNLLALNAAVEAARAGEAGAGFAVVADEVRNLAQRAAGAAKNTSELIEGTIKKIKDGTGLVERTNADFSEVAVAVKKVTELVGEVSAASSEQARGIGEVSGAVSQMDKVTQGNAASAEEIASASEEMNAQATSLQEIVRRLQTLVRGEGASPQMAAWASSAGAVDGGRRMPAAKKRAALSPGPAAKKPSGGNRKSPVAKMRINPGERIPLEEKSMENFQMEGR